MRRGSLILEALLGVAHEKRPILNLLATLNP